MSAERGPVMRPEVEDRASAGHGWSELDPLIRFGVALAGLLFLGVIVEGALLVPYALITNGWVPGR